MKLKLQNERYPPKTLTNDAVWSFYFSAKETAKRGRVQDILEEFIWQFSGGEATRSSTASDAEIRLHNLTITKGSDPPAFITAFVEACANLHEQGVQVPSLKEINGMLRGSGYTVEDDRIPTSYPADILHLLTEAPSVDASPKVEPMRHAPAPVKPVHKPTQKLKVFLCHSKGDKEQVRQLYRRLKSDGYSPWFDEEDLLPGQEWEEEIPKAIRDCHVFLACLTKASVEKTGYLQKEIKFALDVADRQPPGSIYIIPVRLEDCQGHERLTKYQWVDMFERAGYQKLLTSLNVRAVQVGLSAPSAPATVVIQQKHTRSTQGPKPTQTAEISLKDVSARLQITSKMTQRRIMDENAGKTFYISGDIMDVRLNSDPYAKQECPLIELKDLNGRGEQMLMLVSMPGRTMESFSYITDESWQMEAVVRMLNDPQNGERVFYFSHPEWYDITQK